MQIKYTQFKTIYYTLLTLLKTLLWGGVIFWLAWTYKYFSSQAMIDIMKSSGGTGKQLELFLTSLIPWAKTIVILVVWVVVSNILIGIFKKITVRWEWIKKWDDDGHITPILGKRMAYHLRYNPTIGFESFIFMKQYSEEETNLLKYHSDNAFSSAFLRKYDKEFESDIK